VRERIKVLMYNGWRTRGIAEQAGVSYNTVRYVRTGHRPTIHRDSAAAILSLPTQTPIATHSTALVPARSTLRLLDRLRKHHSLEEIARECGVSRKSLPQPGQHSVQARTAKRIREAASRIKARRAAS
jgi:DNA-binding CsgD family transcriptional regulator